MKRARRRAFGELLLFSTVLGTSACGRKTEPPHLPRAAPFIAFERDFQGFRSWIGVELPKLEPQGVTHTEGEAREFINALPTPGSVAFPVGTLIVKEVTNEKKKTHDVFAMAKRGGGYNRSGAPGWEWFELRERADESVAIVWRGINAPNGEDYAGDPLGGCNSCHQLAQKNDFVKTSTLGLSGQGGGKLARE